MKKDLEFLQERIEETKKEIKERKKWKRDIKYELGLQRTYKYNRQDELIRMWKIADKMITHYENILKEQEQFLEECMSL